MDENQRVDEEIEITAEKVAEVKIDHVRKIDVWKGVNQDLIVLEYGDTAYNHFQAIQLNKKIAHDLLAALVMVLAQPIAADNA